MPQNTLPFGPSGFPVNPGAYILAGKDPGFTHDEFTVANSTDTLHLLHQTPAKFSLQVALNGKTLSEGIEYTVEYDTGEFTILVPVHTGDKIEARYAVAQVETETIIRITDDVAINVGTATTTDTVSADLQTPLAVSIIEPVDTDLTTVVDDVNTGVALIIVAAGVVDADDGWTSTVPGFTNTGPTVQVGNSAGEVRDAFLRFPMPHDLAGRSIVNAVLRFTPDAATASPGVKIRFQADASGVAAAPVSKADYDGRVLTAAFVDWQTPLVAGTSIDSPDLSTVVQEVASAGTTTDVLLMLHDNGSATDFFAQLRSFVHSTGPIPQLIVTFD